MAEAKTSEYEVTERAGKRVAGRVVEKGKLLLLTEAEAEHGLSEGTIVPKGKTLAKAFAEDTKPVTRMREEAQAFRARGEPPAAEPDAPAAPAPAPAKLPADPAPVKAGAAA